MKTFEQLTPVEQGRAVRTCLDNLLTDVIEGSLAFNDSLNGDDLQDRINAALAAAERMHTPWFASEYILETCREDLTGMAQCDAEDASYTEPGERIIHGIAGRGATS